MSQLCVMIFHFRNLLESINDKQKQASVVFEDSSGAVSLSRSAKITQRIKPIDVKFLSCSGGCSRRYLRRDSTAEGGHSYQKLGGGQVLQEPPTTARSVSTYLFEIRLQV